MQLSGCSLHGMGGENVPNVTYTIDKYWIYHHTADDANRSASILCYRPEPNHLSPSAYLHFHRDGTTIPASTEVSGILNLRYHEGQFADMTETLRREKPLLVHYNAAAHIGYLMTGREPVGEEELP